MKQQHNIQQYHYYTSSIIFVPNVELHISYYTHYYMKKNKSIHTRKKPKQKTTFPNHLKTER